MHLHAVSVPVAQTAKPFPDASGVSEPIKVEGHPIVSKIAIGVKANAYHAKVIAIKKE